MKMGDIRVNEVYYHKEGKWGMSGYVRVLQRQVRFNSRNPAGGVLVQRLRREDDGPWEPNGSPRVVLARWIIRTADEQAAREARYREAEAMETARRLDRYAVRAAMVWDIEERLRELRYDEPTSRHVNNAEQRAALIGAGFDPDPTEWRAVLATFPVDDAMGKGVVPLEAAVYITGDYEGTSA